MLEAVYTVPMDMWIKMPPRMVLNALGFIADYLKTTDDNKE